MLQLATDIKTQETGATGLRSITAIITDLSKPINPARLKTRQQGGKDLLYVPWHQAVKYLDRYAGCWSSEVRSVASIGGRCVVTVRISIPCLEGVVSREATGQEKEDCGSYGDPSSNAEGMALRRAAAKFGLALYLYDR